MVIDKHGVAEIGTHNELLEKKRDILWVSDSSAQDGSRKIKGFGGVRMSFISVFDVLGPNMVGPSSSHTAGACAIAYLAQK